MTRQLKLQAVDNMVDFDGEAYTDKALIEEMLLIERHAKDGSAAKGGCSCIQDKHMKTVIALAKEGKPLTEKQNKKLFYEQLQTYAEKRLQTIYDLVKRKVSDDTAVNFYNILASEARNWRLNIEGEYFTQPCGCLGCIPCQK